MTQGITLIVGLGNPGQQYRLTRHNAGAMFLESLAQEFGGQFKVEAKFFGASARLSIAGQDVRLLFPATYMNHSGKAVAAVSQYYKIPPANILVAYDELDLPNGTARLKQGGGHGGHNGVRDIISALGDRDFLRLRLGIGHPGDSSKVLNYVLGEPSRQEAETLQASINRAIDIVPYLVEGNHQAAMTTLHTKA